MFYLRLDIIFFKSHRSWIISFLSKLLGLIYFHSAAVLLLLLLLLLVLLLLLNVVVAVFVSAHCKFVTPFLNGSLESKWQQVFSGVTFVSMFHSLFHCLARSRFLYIFSLLFILWCFGMAEIANNSIISGQDSVWLGFVWFRFMIYQPL